MVRSNKKTPGILLSDLPNSLLSFVPKSENGTSFADIERFIILSILMIAINPWY